LKAFDLTRWIIGNCGIGILSAFAIHVKSLVLAHLEYVTIQMKGWGFESFGNLRIHEQSCSRHRPIWS
jgi:hypothetical protein